MALPCQIRVKESLERTIGLLPTFPLGVVHKIEGGVCLRIEINEEHSFPIIFCEACGGFHGGRALAHASFEIDETNEPRFTFVFQIRKQGMHRLLFQ